MGSKRESKLTIGRWIVSRVLGRDWLESKLSNGCCKTLNSWRVGLAWSAMDRLSILSKGSNSQAHYSILRKKGHAHLVPTKMVTNHTGFTDCSGTS